MKLPYIICEVGLNHGGDFQRAVRMIHAIAGAGGNAAKFQAVNADRLVSRSAPTYFHQEGVQAETQWEFFKRSDSFGRAEYEKLAAECEAVGIDFLCTAYDVETVEWLAPLVPAFKIASADITNTPLLKAIRSHDKPVYLSTGASTNDEVQAAIDLLGVGRVTLLHCVLAYPTPVDQAYLEEIALLGYWDTKRPGYSDHTLFNLDVLTTAWLLGASVIEKHFTDDKTAPGNDHYHSMDANDLRRLVLKLRELQVMIGDGEKRVLPCEEAARLNARQSIHATRDLPVGTMVTARDVTLKRPGLGLPPSELPNVIGKQLLYSVRADEAIMPEHLWVRAA